MSLRDPKAKKPQRLPGRFYTLFVTSLATLLIAVPLMRPSSNVWNVTATVRHPETQDDTEQITRGQLQAAAINVGILSDAATETELNELQSNLTTTTEPSGDGSFVTSIQFQHGDQKQARDLVHQVAYGLANAAGEHSQVVSIEAQAAGGIPRGKLLAVMACSLTVGFTTIFFPRRRSRPSESSANKLEEVTNATGLPVIGSVLSAPAKKARKKPSNFPLRLTAFAAELVVITAFLLTLFGAATNTDLLSQMLESPLEGYVHSVRTASIQFQSVLQR